MKSINISELREELRIRNNAIARLIHENIDDDGVIPDAISDELEKIESERTAITTGVLDGLTGYKTLADAVKAKIDRLKKLEKYYRNTEQSLKKILLKVVPEGENILTEDYAITWRTSEFIDVDIFVSVADIEEKFPSAVIVKKEISKAELKRLLKAGAKIDGVEIKKRNNIQIK